MKTLVLLTLLLALPACGSPLLNPPAPDEAARKNAKDFCVVDFSPHSFIPNTQTQTCLWQTQAPKTCASFFESAPQTVFYCFRYDLSSNTSQNSIEPKSLRLHTLSLEAKAQRSSGSIRNFPAQTFISATQNNNSINVYFEASYNTSSPPPAPILSAITFYLCKEADACQSLCQ